MIQRASNFDAKTVQLQLKLKPESFWIKRGETMAVKLFQDMAKRVPAYKDYLKRNRFNPEKVKTINDFKAVPPTSKETYLKQYPLEQLCWDGSLTKGQWSISATSGTSGTPFYFPRTEEQDLQYALTAELYLRENFQIQNKSTLYVNGFALGIWIGGIFTYEAITTVAKRGNYNLSIINPGLNKLEIINSVRALGGKYDQIILAGYPPFIKDVLDEGEQSGMDWSRYRIKFVFSAEAFSEAFRDYIAKKSGLRNLYLDTLNHFGTVDLGTMAHETPTSILIRRLAVENPKLQLEIFGDAKHLPTLAQYVPEMFYFEQSGNRLLCSGRAGLPLVKYDLKDRGGIMGAGQTEQILSLQNISLKQELRDNHLSDHVWNLPYVYVFERQEMGVTWYGANIEAEHIRHAHHHRHLLPFLTGKFTMEVKPNRNLDPVLHIHSELKKGSRSGKKLLQNLKEKIVSNLLDSNSEYKNNYTAFPKKNTPSVHLWNYESAPYFKTKGKQKWVNR